MRNGTAIFRNAGTRHAKGLQELAPSSALRDIDQEAMVTEEIQKLCEMEKMGGEVGAGHKNVIEIDKSEWEVAEDVINELLKCLSSILEAKGHGEEFIEAKRSDDGSLWDIRGSNRNLIVCNLKQGRALRRLEP